MESFRESRAPGSFGLEGAPSGDLTVSQLDDLVCPDCHTPLQITFQDGQQTLTCLGGHGPWFAEKRTVQFIANKEVPQDDRWTATYREPPDRGLLSWIRRRNTHWGIPLLLAPMIARAGRYPLHIVDLGCGGSWEFLKKFGRVTGIDHGVKGLVSGETIYERVIRAPVESLPLANQSVDVVVSIWVFEHLPEIRFVAMLREIRRVLRPGGRLVFFADLDSSKTILRWAKRYPESYFRNHIEAVGHYGLRSLVFTKFLLQREGFAENETIPVNKSSLLQPVTALWMFNNELGRQSKLLMLYLQACRLTLKSRFLYRFLSTALMEYHRLVDRRLPESYAFSAAFDWILPETRGLPAASSKAIVLSRTQEKIEPWSGLPTLDSAAGRRPVAVMLDNSSGSHPQIGLASASVVIEAPVEGGLTRLMPIFTRDYSDLVGPVRSARPYFMDWAQAYQPFFLYCGASPEARSRLQQPENLIAVECRYLLRDQTIDIAQNAATFAVDRKRIPPHHIFAVPEKIFGNLQELTVNLPEAFAACQTDLIGRYEPELYSAFHTDAIADNERNMRVQIDIRSQPDAVYADRFEWDGTGFRRSVIRTSTGDILSHDPKLLVANLVLIWVRVKKIAGDLKGRLSIHTCGEGPAQMWIGPRPQKANWYRSAPPDSMQFRDTFGRSILCRPGLTWICALPDNAIVLVK